MAEIGGEARYRSNLQSEVDSAELYRALESSEKDPQVARVYGQLAAIEEAHVAFWRRKLEAIGRPPGAPRAGFRTRALAFLARRFGPEFVLPAVNSLEQQGVATYDTQTEAADGRLAQAERSHARIIRVMSRNAPRGVAGAVLGRVEGRHKSGGNALRAAVLGANDGLVSNLSLVMGVAGAEPNPRAVMLAGIAGLVAGACSMALGEWLSVNSARELYQQQIETEAQELALSPDEEREELVLIYQAKGLPEAQAQETVARLMSNPETALDSLIREELGIDPDELGGSAWAASGTSFLLFALGAAFPILGLALFHDGWAIPAALAFSGAALFLIGAGTSLFTGRGVVFSGLRQLAIGLAAAGVTYGAGRLLGVTLS